MPSTSEAVAIRLQALLNGATDAGASVYRDRDDAMSRDEPKALLIELIDEDTTPMGGGHPVIGAVDSNRLRFVVMACVRAQGWQAQADVLRCQAHALIATDVPLRALVANLRRERCEWKPANADQPFGYAAQIYSATTLNRAHALDLYPN